MAVLSRVRKAGGYISLVRCRASRHDLLLPRVSGGQNPFLANNRPSRKRKSGLPRSSFPNREKIRKDFIPQHSRVKPRRKSKTVCKRYGSTVPLAYLCNTLHIPAFAPRANTQKTQFARTLSATFTALECHIPTNGRATQVRTPTPRHATRHEVAAGRAGGLPLYVDLLIPGMRPLQRLIHVPDVLHPLRVQPLRKRLLPILREH